MNSPTPARRQGAHRTGRGLVPAVMPSVLAVVAVAALITSLAVWRGQDPVQPQAAAATTSSTPATREAMSQAPATATPTASPSASATAAVTSAPVTTVPARSTPRDVQVVVLNQTSRAGLASDVADALRGRGWTVAAVGNFHGTVPATTVYYPPGDELAAQTAAEDLQATPRIRPRFGNLSTSRLTVVVTDSYPG
jgi:LytR cell envelope-related transcriptional attenuator